MKKMGLNKSVSELFYTAEDPKLDSALWKTVEDK